MSAGIGSGAPAGMIDQYGQMISGANDDEPEKETSPQN